MCWRCIHRFRPRTIPELIAHAKANPGKLDMASAGIGSPGHVSGELFKMMAGVDMVHVPYRGVAPALSDLLGGQVHVMVDNMPTAIEHIRAGRLRALAVTSARRSDMLPDVPAMSEFLPGYEATSWFGIGAPRNTPVEIIELLNREINAAFTDREHQGAHRRHGSCGLFRVVRRFRETPRQRNRKVGQGGEVLGREGGLIARIASGRWVSLRSTHPTEYGIVAWVEQSETHVSPAAQSKTTTVRIACPLRSAAKPSLMAGRRMRWVISSSSISRPSR